MSGLWNQPGVPHKGWVFIDIEDLGYPATICEMCRSQEIRYVHYMEHAEYDRRLGVGCVCAEKMSGDLVNPRKREQRLQSKSGRRSRWLSRKWKISSKGNPYLKADGVHLVIFPFRQGRKSGKYGYQVNGVFGDGAYETIEEAKLAAFEAWWEAAHGG